MPPNQQLHGFLPRCVDISSSSGGGNNYKLASIKSHISPVASFCSDILIQRSSSVYSRASDESAGVCRHSSVQLAALGENPSLTERSDSNSHGQTVVQLSQPSCKVLPSSPGRCIDTSPSMSCSVKDSFRAPQGQLFPPFTFPSSSSLSPPAVCNSRQSCSVLSPVPVVTPEAGRTCQITLPRMAPKPAAHLEQRPFEKSFAGQLQEDDVVVDSPVVVCSGKSQIKLHRLRCRAIRM